MFSWRNKKNIIWIAILLIGAKNKYLEESKLREHIFSTSRLLIDDQSVLQNDDRL